MGRRIATVVPPLVLLLPGVAAVAPILRMMPEHGMKGKGAVCLDGSDAGFYFAASPEAAREKDWQIYFVGGGWCYDELDCWGRSNTQLGSSKDWPMTNNFGGGIISDDCQVNPEFCNFNRVIINYCDGSSFSGNREDPLIVKGEDGKNKSLYFRGQRIVDAVLESLLPLGLKSAEQVMLTGCSAGGLATFMHADYVKEYLVGAGVPLKRHKAVPISGFFMLHDNLEGYPVYPEQMNRVWKMANSSSGVNKECTEAKAGDEAWKCMFARYNYAHTQVPIFPLNSALDSWQTNCIFASKLVKGYPHQNTTDNGECGKVPGFTKCGGSVADCSAEQVTMMNTYLMDFSLNIQWATQGAFRKDGNGAFIHSCNYHCEGQVDALWQGIKINGFTMEQAVSGWWHSSEDPASWHTFTNTCLYNAAPGPARACNPTCSPGGADPSDPFRKGPEASKRLYV